MASKTKKAETNTASPRRRLEQLVSNPDCSTNAASALLQIPLTEIAKARGAIAGPGQSPFAFEQGALFEKRILTPRRKNGLIPLKVELEKHGLLIESAPFEQPDLRARGYEASFDDSIAFLNSISTKANKETQYLGAGFRFIAEEIPPGGGDVEIDLVLIRFNDLSKKWSIGIGEIKTYPDRAGLTDPQQLATARAQSGLYRRLLMTWLARKSLTEHFEVAELGFLVFMNVRSAWPSVLPHETLVEQDERADKAIELFNAKYQSEEWTEWLTPSVSLEERFKNLVDHASTHYTKACWSFCPAVEVCFEKLIDADDPVILGADAKEILGERTIEYVQKLLAGQVPPTAADAEILEKLTDATFDRVIG